MHLDAVINIPEDVKRRAVTWVMQEHKITQDLLDKFDAEQQQHFLDLCDSVAQDMQFNQLEYFRPFPHQVKFFTTGSTHSRRGLLAANRSGKSVATCYEAAYHLTGLYPSWWTGRKFTTPVTVFAAGESWSQVALVLQRELLGTEDIKLRHKLGTGAIPRKNISSGSIRSDGANVLSLEIIHKSGQCSTLMFGNYTQEVRNMQGFKLHLAIFDEQPPDDMFSELTTRTATLQGQVLCSFTPLKGLNGLVRKFWENIEGYTHVRVSWDDLPEYDLWGEPFFLQADREQLLRDYMPHEREARTQGIPVMGRGAVFPMLTWPTYTSAELDLESRTDLHRLISLDLGLINDSTVLSFFYWDPRLQRAWLHRQVVVTGRTEALPDFYIQYLLTPQSQGVPIALPADASRAGVYTLTAQSVREVFEEYGLNVIREPIQNPRDAQGRKSNNKSFGINQMRQAMERGDFMINVECREFMEQARNYFVDEHGRYSDPDDAIDSARYGYLALLQGWGEPVQFLRGVVANQQKFNTLRHHYNLLPRSKKTCRIYDPRG